MKAYLEVLIYEDTVPKRSRFKVYDGDFANYDPFKRRPVGQVTGYFFEWKDAKKDEEVKNGVLVWETCEFSDEEREQLIKEGKMVSFKTNQNDDGNKPNGSSL